MLARIKYDKNTMRRILTNITIPSRNNKNMTTVEIQRYIVSTVKLWSKTKYNTSDITVLFGDVVLGWVDPDGEICFSVEVFSSPFQELKCVACYIDLSGKARIAEHLFLDPHKHCFITQEQQAEYQNTRTACNICTRQIEVHALNTNSAAYRVYSKVKVIASFDVLYHYRCDNCVNEWVITKNTHIKRSILK